MRDSSHFLDYPLIKATKTLIPKKRKERIIFISLSFSIWMRNCIIIHGCPSNKDKTIDPKTRTYDKHWIPWLTKELEKRDFSVNAPLMPTPWNAKYEEWKKIMDKINVNKKSILVGHSCGGAFLVRWLGETKKRTKKLILVAPAKMLESMPEKYFDFYNFETDLSITNRVNEIVIFVSDNEGEGIRKAVKRYSKEFNIQPREIKGKGHFLLKHMGTEEFPELLSEIIK